MRNRKGLWLGENVGKLIIAALVIIVLVIFGFKLYGMFVQENQVRKAETNLNLIEEKINYLLSPDYTLDFLYVKVYAPKKGWFLRSFEQQEFPKEVCIGRFETCLCFCENIGCGGLKACKGFEKELEINKIEIGSGAYGGAVGYAPAPSVYENTLQFKDSIEELKISEERVRDDYSKIIISESDREE